MWIVPMQAETNHKFSAVIPIDGKDQKLQFKLMYNEVGAFWSLDISKNDKELIVGLPLIPAHNLLEQLSYLGVGSLAVVERGKIAEMYPSYSTLSSEWYVLWGDTA